MVVNYLINEPFLHQKFAFAASGFKSCLCAYSLPAWTSREVPAWGGFQRSIPHRRRGPGIPAPLHGLVLLKWSTPRVAPLRAEAKDVWAHDMCHVRCKYTGSIWFVQLFRRFLTQNKKSVKSDNLWNLWFWWWTWWAWRTWWTWWTWMNCVWIGP